MVSALRNLGITWISCFGHNLDLAIKKSFNISHLHKALARCHSIVELFHLSWKKARDLRNKQKQLDLPQHKLMGDVPTRLGVYITMVA